MTSAIKINESSHLHFVTGKLAQHAVREIVESLAKRYRFEFSIGVMPITVAALITPQWLVRKLQVPSGVTHVVVPGFCRGGSDLISDHVSAEDVVGPNDCRDLPELFGGKGVKVDLSEYSVEIIAEINHAPRLDLGRFAEIAAELIDQGADRIDIGCDPAQRCEAIGDYVRTLVDQGIAVSIDTFDPREAETACKAGASLVLSVNSNNRAAAPDWGTEVVVIPDTPSDLEGMDETIQFLAARKVPMRLDPILEPIGSGLTESLVRYWKTRQRYSDMPMMMGIGNLTELTDVDSAGINMVLLGICQELRITSVLTTQVINWARSSVQECDVARRLAHASVRHGTPPKNFSDDLVMLRDHHVTSFSDEALDQLAEAIKDNNYRLFAQGAEIHLVTRQLHLSDEDPFRLFDALTRQPISDNVDRGHAFYLGYEMAKASIALTLGKQYEQDRALNWGMLTRDEDLHRIGRSNRHQKPG